MARKFLYLVAILIFLVIAAAFSYRLYGDELLEIALVPDSEFVDQQNLPEDVYASNKLWFSRPGMVGDNPALWLPAGFVEPTISNLPVDKSDDKSADKLTIKAAIFYIHPTSYYSRTQWNAPLDDAESQSLAALFLRGQASAFNGVGEVWAPRYRQATIGAFLTDKPEGQQALNAAYQDVLTAFDYFIAQLPSDQPIILAGHSQGSRHLSHLLKDRVAGTPLARRIVAAYIIGWPISLETDVPQMGLEACATAEQSNCLLSWESYAEPADYSRILQYYAGTTGFDGRPRAGTAILCSNPLNGIRGSSADAADNLGTLVPNADLTDASLVKQSIPARCDDNGFLLIGEPPDLGPYALPGNNYHVYDYSLFWANIRADISKRMTIFLANR